jgi:hypothetical protein
VKPKETVLKADWLYIVFGWIVDWRFLYGRLLKLVDLGLICLQAPNFWRRLGLVCLLSLFGCLLFSALSFNLITDCLLAYVIDISYSFVSFVLHVN